MFPRTKAEFSRLWLVAALSCPTAILNWLWVDWNHISGVTFITSLVSLHWALRFPRSNCKRFLSFRPWSMRGDPSTKSRHESECKKSHSAYDNANSPTEKGMWLLLPFSFLFLAVFLSFCYCVFINMLGTLVTYPDRVCHSLRLEVIKGYISEIRQRGKMPC